MRYLKIDNYIVTTPIIDILRRLQIVLTNGKLKDIKDGADNIVVTCPNNKHAGGHESTPACNIYIGNDTKIEYGLARCFVCGYTASFVEFVASCFNYSVDFAKNWLIQNYGILAEEKFIVGDDIVIKNKSVKPVVLNESILDQYLPWSDYLATRGITKQTAQMFNLKYDPKYRQIIFPYYNEHNQLTSLLKRSIDTKTFFIETGIKKPVYGINNIFKNNIHACVLTEGLFDCLLANQYGMPTIATLGSPSAEQFELINKSPLSVVYLMFDNDAAGKSFTAKAHEQLADRIIAVDVNIIGKKDIGELTYDEFWNFLNKAKS